MILQWLAHVLGLDNLSGPFYGWWSGAGSDIGEVAMLGAIWGLFRKHNCHVDRCWRLGKHPVAGTPYTVCARHHPDVPEKVGHMQIRSAHWRARSGR